MGTLTVHEMMRRGDEGDPAPATASGGSSDWPHADVDLYREVTDEVLPAILGGRADGVRVDVHHGVVVLFGAVEERGTGERVARAVAHVDGVASVVNAVAYRRDTIPPAAAGVFITTG